MLAQLYLVHDYFDRPDSVLYEDDLIRHFGREAISHALRNGLLRHKLISCGRQAQRRICWLNRN